MVEEEDRRSRKGAEERAGASRQRPPLVSSVHGAGAGCSLDQSTDVTANLQSSGEVLVLDCSSGQDSVPGGPRSASIPMWGCKAYVWPESRLETARGPGEGWSPLLLWAVGGLHLRPSRGAEPAPEEAVRQEDQRTVLRGHWKSPHNPSLQEGWPGWEPRRASGRRGHRAPNISPSQEQTLEATGV